ncbi:hybrid sensor histidine kinase/response regulator [Vibrio ponticus]|uniref:histidine kinase n=1 Tax=Vibrio ponticus TaxID=265668 RepID=A0ABX3FHZ7_9VIBR|nr:hybrid sensor histidine kinase/response regulator [Vibrio ponticus]OLQ93799.1 hybrid sensor histidine kinase/response regulator [Vibrio ponticus]
MTESVYDPQPNGVIGVDEQGVIIDINQAAYRVDIWKVRPSVGATLAECLQQQQVKRWHLKQESGAIQWQDGTGKFWQIECLPMGSNQLLWLTEQTEKIKLKAQVEHLQHDIERLDYAAQGANLGIWDFNPLEGKIIANRTWATQKKLETSDVFVDGQLFSEIVNGIERWATLVHPDDIEPTQQKIKDHLEGKTDLYHAEFRVQCGDGGWKWILDQGKVFERDDQGAPVRMNGIHVDVDKLKALQQKLSKTKEKAEVANRAKSIFLANMSHELRTPLNAILGYSQLMKTEPNLPIKHKEYLDIINRSGEHLLALINNVLDMSKIDAGYNVAELKWFNLREMVEEVVDLMQMKASQKQLHFVAEIAPSVPSFVQGDAVKTRQVLINLLGNAIKFTEVGHVKLTLEAKASPDGNNRIKFEICDSGIGIAPEDLSRIFIPFEQVASLSTQNGTGLGLSISKQFVDLMGGDLDVASQLNHGTTFSFSLDLLASDWVDQPILSPSQQIKKLSENSWIPKILIAEDQTDNQALLSTLLTQAGFKVKIAQDGEEAVTLFQHWQPDFIWMDRRMPKMDGLEATRAIRQLPNGLDVKIVALTASVFNDEIEQMLKAGMDDFARKPYQAQTLFMLLQKHLEVEYEYFQETQPAKEYGQLQASEIELACDLAFAKEILAAIALGDQQRLLEQFQNEAVFDGMRSELLGLAESYQFDELYELFGFAAESDSA